MGQSDIGSRRRAGVVVGAYLAAVYLVWDARRMGDPSMVEYFRRRAIGAAVVAGVVALVGIFVFATTPATCSTS